MKKYFILALTLLGFAAFGQNYEAEFSNRANMLIEQVADYYPSFSGGLRPSGFKGDLSDFGKYNYPKIIGLYKKYGAASDTANIRIDRYKNLPTFHFNIVGHARIMYLFNTIPAVANTDTNYIRRAWNRTDSYNIMTVEGTENHLSMTKPAGYLYAQKALSYPANFPDAQQRLDSLKKWIMYQSKRIVEVGNGEWNSTTYGTYNVIGWLNLYDFAGDTMVKKAARAVLDFYAAELAMHYKSGLVGGPDLRGNRNVKSFAGSTAYLGWLWFGQSPVPLTAATLNNGAGNATDMAQVIHAATSKYRPPLHIVALANGTTDEFYKNSRPGYLLENASLIKQTVYNTPNYVLGAAYLPYGGWCSGDWQTVPWKLTMAVDSAPNKSGQFVSGMGMMDATSGSSYNHGNFRSPFDQLVHHKNLLIQMTRVPNNAAALRNSINNIINTWKNNWLSSFDQRFPTDTDKSNPINGQLTSQSSFPNQSFLLFSNAGITTSEATFQNNILFIEFEKVFVAARSIRNQQLTAPALNSPMYYSRDNAPADSLCGFVIEVGEKSVYGTMANFKNEIVTKTKLIKTDVAQLKIKYIGLMGDTIEAEYKPNGNFTEPIYDWGYGPTTPQNIQTSPPFIQPDWSALGTANHGKIAEWKVNGQLIDLNTHWPVFSGPRITLDSGVMVVTNQNTFYKVDYTGNQPYFTTGTITSVAEQTISVSDNQIANIYPNPTNGSEFNIELSEPINLNQFNIVLIDVAGRITQPMFAKTTHKVAKVTLNHNLPAGIYWIKVTNGAAISSQKLIVK